VGVAFLKLVLGLLVPHGLLLGAIAVYLHQGASPPVLATIQSLYPGGVLIVGVLLGWRFNRSRLIFTLVVLALADRALLTLSGVAGQPGAAKAVFDTVAFLLPLNYLAFALLTERGLLTARGGLRIGFILLQVMAVLVMYSYQPAKVLGWLNHGVLDKRLFSWTLLAQPALCAYLGVAALLLTRFVLYRKSMESGFFWSLAATVVALHAPKGFTTIYFATAGFIPVVALIETSYSLAYRDELTDLPTRRALKEYLLKLGSRYTTAMVDVDHFKQFNDKYGHDVGDQVLRMVAAKLAEVSGGGKAFRYGGEEFTVIFSGKSLAEVMVHLEALRAAIEIARFTLRGRKRPRNKPENMVLRSLARKRLSVTVSIGVAERDSRNTDPEMVLKAADKALYRAKEGGRNKVSL
jgi:diguanylate cyclase (GGDEF)-like protein